MYVRNRCFPFTLTFLFLAAVQTVAFPQSPVAYDKIIELLKLEVKEEKLLKLLADQPTVFTISDAQKSELKASGASETLLAAMAGKAANVVESDTAAYCLILDCSGSMLEATSDGATKWTAAKRAASELISAVPEGLRVAVVVYGHDRNKACAVEILRPLSPITVSEKEAVIARIQEIQPIGKTPLGSSLRVATGELAQCKGLTKMLLITDGIETCNGNAVAEAEKFVASSNGARSIDVVGFSLATNESAVVAKIADSGKGQYYDAQTSKDLVKAIDVAKADVVESFTTEGEVIKKASADIEAPASLPMRAYTKVRLPEDKQHYWKVDFPAGESIVVFDVAKLSGDNIGNLSAGFTIGEMKEGKMAFEGLGKRITTGGTRERSVLHVRFGAPTTTIVRVDNQRIGSQTMEYNLGVFQSGDKFGVPFLVKSRAVASLELGTALTTPKLWTNPEHVKDGVIFYRIALPGGGDYIAEFDWQGEGRFQQPWWVHQYNSEGVDAGSLVGASIDKGAKVKIRTVDDTEMLIGVSAGRQNDRMLIKIYEADE